MFEYLAIWSAKRARGRPFAVMVMLIVITAAASALLDNVTTVLLVAPVTLLVCDRLGVTPVPFLIAEAMASNIGGTATLIGDPPNIIIASRSGLSFNDFLLNLAPLIIVLVAVLVLLCRWMFRSAFVYDEKRAAKVMQLDEREVIKDKRLLVQCGVVLSLVMVGFIAHGALDIDPSLVALLGAGALVAAVQDAAARVPRGRRVDDPGLLHGSVRDGRRPGRGRRDQQPGGPARGGGRRQLPARRHEPDLRLGGPVGHHRQHPLRRDAGPRRRRTSSTPALVPTRPPRCGGRWPSAPTWAATPPPSGPARTW